MNLEYRDWSQTINDVREHVVRISTPHGSGTGFYVSTTQDGALRAIATASHVIAQAHYWELPIRIEKILTRESLLLRHQERSIFLNESNDTAAIVYSGNDINFPTDPLPLAPENRFLNTGYEIGWLGYPGVAPHEMCFFSGRISSARHNPPQYLVDGVAINGVSGGPAFWNGTNQTTIIGVLSAYIPNLATGVTLPGLSVVQNVNQFHDIARQFKDLDEAKANEAWPHPAPSPTPSPPLD